MSYQIKAIEYYVPEKVITNEYLSESCGIDPKFTETQIGIKERRIAPEDEPTSFMAAKAVEKLIVNTSLSYEDIDLLLVCTQNPDYRLPTTACIVQDRLGLSKSTLAFDLNLGCSGFVYSLPVAGNFILTGQIKNAVIVMADQYSKILDYKDKTTAPIFGDAASATWLSECDKDFGVVDAVFGTDGSGAEKLIAWNSGIARREDKKPFVYMDGMEIFKFSIKVVPSSVNELLEKNNLKTTDIKHFVLHQANQYMLKEIKKRMKLTDEQLVIDLKMVGNTISSTIPIALKGLLEKNSLQKGDYIVFSGYGVGLSWGSVLYKYI